MKCQYCFAELPMTAEDRESWPILVDMLVDCHERRCEPYILATAFFLVGALERELRAVAS